MTFLQCTTAAIVATALALTPALVAQEELHTVTSPAAGIAVDVPESWNAIPIATGLLSMSPERNERGQPSVTLNITQQDLRGKTFAAFQAEQEELARVRSKEGDRHTVATLDHAAGPAFVHRRLTTTANGQTQAVYAFYVEASNGTWFISWVVPPEDDPTRFDELAEAVVTSFRSL